MEFGAKLRRKQFPSTSFLTKKSTIKHQGLDAVSSNVRLFKFRFEIVFSKNPIQPQIRQLLLNAVRAEAVVEIFEIDEVEMLILVKA